MPLDPCHRPKCLEHLRSRSGDSVSVLQAWEMLVPVHGLGLSCVSCAVKPSLLVTGRCSSGAEWSIFCSVILPPVADFILILQQQAFVSSWSRVTGQPQECVCVYRQTYSHICVYLKSYTHNLLAVFLREI